MKPSPSTVAAPSGDWLVVIDRHEASVFRSTAPGAASQCIHAHLPEEDAGMRQAVNGQNGHGRPRFFGFFEPLAGVLHGARRILLFGRATPLGDETSSFVFWLCNQHPEIAGRIVASEAVEPNDMNESDLLAKARAFYARLGNDAPAPPTALGRNLINQAGAA